MRGHAYLLAVSLVLMVLAPGTASGTEEYARLTGRKCAACHVNPLGEGELTRQGEGFLAGLAAAGRFKPLGPAVKAARLVAGYLHILAGVVWFGTIFYVHIILKPAYASKGLPRGELVLGWTCIAVAGVTGALLTYARMPSLEAFHETRFGVLLSIKIALFLVMAGSAGLVTFVLGPRMKRRLAVPPGERGEYTAEELSNFDGKEGRKALVAYQGTVYDLTDSRLWKGGRHMRHLAGEDLTGALEQAPHGPEKLDLFPRAGRLASDGPKGPVPDRPRAAFYFMAYMNLALVFLILGIVALWRWW